MSAQRPDQLVEFEAILDKKVTLTSEQKAIIKARYIGLVREAEASHWRTTIAHHVFGNSIMIAGVVLAALIPLAEFIGSSASTAIFWINWGLALGIAIFNGIMRLFNVSKKYVLGMTSLEKMRAEGWMFLEEIGRYSKHPDDNFRLFCSRIEKIKDGVVGKTADNAVAQRGSDIDDTDAMPTWRGAPTARSVRILRPVPKKAAPTPSSDDDNVVVDVSDAPSTPVKTLGA